MASKKRQSPPPTSLEDSSGDPLSRRERQIMDVVYRQGEASAAEIQQTIPDAPSYSAVRALMRILEEKGHLSHRKQGQRYIYSPTVSPSKARKGALHRLVQTFFGGSVEETVASLLDLESSQLSGKELERLEALVAEARRREQNS